MLRTQASCGGRGNTHSPLGVLPRVYRRGRGRNSPAQRPTVLGQLYNRGVPLAHVLWGAFLLKRRRGRGGCVGLLEWRIDLDTAMTPRPDIATRYEKSSQLAFSHWCAVASLALLNWFKLRTACRASSTCFEWPRIVWKSISPLIVPPRVRWDALHDCRRQ